MTPKSSASPFIGPRPFEPGDQSVFFGRERETRDLLNLVLVFPAVLLYSKSGAGKSSLVNAGLAPLAAAQGKKVLPTARVIDRLRSNLEGGRNPLVANAIECLDADLQLSHSPGAASLTEYLAGRPDRSEDRIVIFDQFEECFTQVLPRGQRQQFFQDVANALAHSRNSLAVVFVIREEYVAEFDPYLSLLPGRLASRLRIGPLARDATYLALAGPLQQRGIRFQSGAAEYLLDLLSGQRVQSLTGGSHLVPGEFIEPVQLQVVATELWESLPPGASEISLADVEALGGHQVLAAWLEKTVRHVASHTGVKPRAILEWCRKVLITPAGTRAIVFRGETETAGMSNSVIDELEQQHVVRRELRAGAVWDELSHDQFVGAVLAALESVDLAAGSEAERSRWEGRAARWVEGGRSPKDLLGPGQVAEAAAWIQTPAAQEIGVTPTLVEYVDASRRSNERVATERRHLLAVMVVLAALLLCISGLAIWLKLTRDQVAQQASVESELRYQSKLRDEEAQLLAEQQKKELITKEGQIEAARNREQALLAQRDNAEQRRTTAYSLSARVKNMVPLGTGILPPPLPLAPTDTLQSAYKAAYLSAFVTQKNDGNITPDAADALRLVLPTQSATGGLLSVPGTLSPSLSLTWAGLPYGESEFGTLRVWSIPAQKLTDEAPVPQASFGPIPPPPGARPLRWLAESPPRYIIHENDSVVVIDVGAKQTVRSFKVLQSIDVLGITPDNRPILATPPGLANDAIDPSGRAIRIPLPAEAALAEIDRKGRWAVVAEFDPAVPASHIRVLRIPEATPLTTFDAKQMVTAAAVSSDGRKVLANYADGSVALWQAGIEKAVAPPAKAQEVPASPPCGPSIVSGWNSLAFNSADTAAVIQCFGADSQSHTWILDVSSGEIVEAGAQGRTQAAPLSQINTPSVSWFGDSTIVRHDVDNGFSRWNRSGQLLDRPVVFPDPGSPLTFSADDRQVFSSLRGQFPTIWDIQGNTLEKNAASPAGTFAGAAVDPTGKWIALSDKTTVKMFPFAAAASKLERTEESACYLLAVAGEGKRIAAADLFGRIDVFTPGSGAATVIAAGHSIAALAISGSGSIVAAVTLDGTVRIWNADGQPLHAPPSAKSKASALFFHGEELAIGREDGSVVIIDPKTGAVLRSAPITPPLGVVRAFAFDRAHNILAVGGDTRTVLFKPSGLKVLDFVLSSDVYSNILALAFDSGGTRLATLTSDGTLRVAPVRSEDLMRAVGALISDKFDRNECRELGAPVCPTDVGHAAPPVSK